MNTYLAMGNNFDINSVIVPCESIIFILMEVAFFGTIIRWITSTAE